MQKLYKEPVKEKLIAQRVKEIKAGKVYAAVSCIPQNAEKFAKIAEEAGADLFVGNGWRYERLGNIKLRSTPLIVDSLKADRWH